MKLKAYSVYFHGVADKCREDIYATSATDAENIIAAKYGLATHIVAYPLFFDE